MSVWLFVNTVTPSLYLTLVTISFVLQPAFPLSSKGSSEIPWDCLCVLGRGAALFWVSVLVWSQKSPCPADQNLKKKNEL